MGIVGSRVQLPGQSDSIACRALFLHKPVKTIPLQQIEYPTDNCGAALTVLLYGPQIGFKHELC